MAISTETRNAYAAAVHYAQARQFSVQSALSILFLCRRGRSPGTGFLWHDVRGYSGSQSETDSGLCGGQLHIVYQGGEPTLAGLDFFRRAMELEQKWNVNGVVIHHSIQTNGMVLDREWAAFFREHRFLVGLSLDGNRKVHDANRLDPTGQGTFGRVMESLNLLKE